MSMAVAVTRSTPSISLSIDFPRCNVKARLVLVPARVYDCLWVIRAAALKTGAAASGAVPANAAGIAKSIFPGGRRAARTLRFALRLCWRQAQCERLGFWRTLQPSSLRVRNGPLRRRSPPTAERLVEAHRGFEPVQPDL